MKKSLEDVINLYRKFVTIPEPVGACISKQSKGDNLVIKSQWKQADLERSEQVKFNKTYMIKHGKPNQFDVQFTNIATENNELWNKESPSGKWTAIIRNIKTKKEEEKQYIEVWDAKQKVKNYDVTVLEKHGKICDPDDQFGCLSWSSNEKSLLYIAEKKKPKTVSYFDNKPKKDEKGDADQQIKGHEHDFEEDWGEQLVGKVSPVICILDINTGDVSVLDNVAKDCSLGQAMWAPSDTGVVFIGWKNVPYRLGLIYCPTRENGIYYWEKASNKCEILSDESRSSFSPRLSPDGKKLIYFDNEIGGPHYQCSRLMLFDWKSKQTSVIVDVVKDPAVDEFQGIYVQSLPTSCWSTDNNRIILSSFSRSSVIPLVIDVEKKLVTRLKTGVRGDASVIDVCDDGVLFKCSALNQPPYLAFGSLPPNGQDDEMSLNSLDESITLPDISWEVLTFTPSHRPHSQYGVLNYECVLVSPESKEPPLVVFPHGGPHSVFTQGYVLYTACMVACGYAVLCVNYRGSLGFGDNNLRSLPGNVGDQDVKDCQEAAVCVVKSGKVNGKQVVVFGGSHGGFLTTHLIGQYPEFYKAACCRNPVIDIATMVGTTDIPDWSFYESGFDFNHKSVVNDKILGNMWSKSPIRYVDKVECPCLIMLGSDDLRVPVKQGREFFRALKARNKLTRLISYEGNSHPIIKVDCQADAFINMMEWFRKYLVA